MSAAQSIIDAVSVWLWIGAAVAVPFLTIGIDRIDEDARGAYLFRVLLVPGVLVIWPLVLWRWAMLETGAGRWQSRYRPPRAAHTPVSIALFAGVFLLIVSGLAVRQTWPVEIAPERLSAPEVSQ